MTQDSDRQAGGNWKGYLQIAAIAVVIIAAVYFARAPGQIEITGDPEQADQKPVVHVLQPELTSQAIDLQLTGSVGLKDRVTVSSEVVGRVAWVSPMFEPGGTIKANEVFIRIDPAEYELRVREAMIQQQLAEEAMQLPGRPQSISQNLLELAEVTMELAELQLSRTEISLPYPIRVISSSVEVGEVAGPADTRRPRCMHLNSRGTVSRENSAFRSAGAATRMNRMRAFPPYAPAKGSRGDGKRTSPASGSDIGQSGT